MTLQRSIGNVATQRLLRSPYIQTKLQISKPGDPLEQEADRTAETVMRMPEPVVQRACNGCEEAKSVQRACNDCEEEQDVMRKEQGGAGNSTSAGAPHGNSSAVSQNIQALNGGGSPLPPSTRAFFEPRFGADLSNVRVHTDSRADEAAKSIDAKAFTFGGDIAFASGQYSPESHAGKQLLAHELTHTIQQAQSPTLHRQVIQRDALQSTEKKKDDGLSLAAFDAQNRGIIAALSFEQLKTWHDIIQGWKHNRQVEERLARHEKRSRSKQWDPSVPNLASDYLAEQSRIKSGGKFVDESQSRVKLDHSAILGPDITAPQPWNVDAENRFRNWAVTHFLSKPLTADLTAKPEYVSALEESQHPGLGSGIPHVSLRWGGVRIKHTRGMVTWNDLMDIEEFKERYYSDVTNSPGIQAVRAGIIELDSHIRTMKDYHQNRSEANARRPIVRRISEALGGPGIELIRLRLKVYRNPNDVHARAELAEKEAEAGNYPKLQDNAAGPGIWHVPDQTLSAATRFLEQDKFELAVAALAACQQATVESTARFAGYERRIMGGAGLAVKWLERAKTAGKVASAFTGAGGLVRSALGSAGYSFAQEGSQQVVAHWIDPSNKIDLESLTKQAAIEGLASLFGGITQGAFVKALSARFGARLLEKGLSEGTAQTLLSGIGATTAAFYSAPAEIVLQNIIAGKAFPNSLAEVADMITTEALQSAAMDMFGHFAQGKTKPAPETPAKPTGKEIAPPREVVNALAGSEGAAFVKNLEKTTGAGGAGPGTVKTAEIDAGRAVEHVNQHPELIKDRNKPGKRHAPVGDGHEIVEVPTPAGIVCELHSTPRKVRCPEGMGTNEPAPVADLTEVDRLLSRPLPEKLKTDLFQTLAKAVRSNDYHPDRLSAMVTALRGMSARDITHQLSKQVQLNLTSRSYHDSTSIWWGRMSKTETVSMLEAQVRGYGWADAPTRRLQTGAKGEILSDVTTAGGDESKIDVLVGDPVDRQGLENALPSRSKVKDKATKESFDIMVAERLHAIGAGFGAESGTQITHGASIVNQALQNRGVEQLIRFLHANRPPGIRYIVHADVSSKAGPAGTRPLERITYRVTAVEELPNGQFRPIRAMFEGTISHPKKIVAATRPRGRGDIQGIGVEVEAGFGALAEHFGL